MRVRRGRRGEERRGEERRGEETRGEERKCVYRFLSLET